MISLKRIQPIGKLSSFKNDDQVLDAVKKAFDPVINLTETCVRIMEDKQIKFSEILELISIAPSIPLVIQNAKTALRYAKVFKPKMAHDFAEWFEAEFDIKDDKAEVRIEKAVYLLADSYEAASAVIKVIPKYQEYYKLIAA